MKKISSQKSWFTWKGLVEYDYLWIAQDPKCQYGMPV